MASASTRLPTISPVTEFDVRWENALSMLFYRPGQGRLSLNKMLYRPFWFGPWGGLADRHTGRPWGRDTIGLVWSSTKGATALCAHMQVSRGLLDLDRSADEWRIFNHGLHG